MMAAWLRTEWPLAIKTVHQAYQLLPQNTTTSKREARRWWMNAGALNVDRNVSFCASICSKEGLLIVSKTLAQREG